MSKCWIALGGNLGSVADTFKQAAERLHRVPGLAVVQMSSFYTTAPVGADAGHEFLNAAAELQTTIPPWELLTILQRVETELGRERTIRWGPRTLDLDLLLYDQQTLATPTLTIPHPHLWYRRFVLDPLTEIAPDLVHCQHALTISELLEQLRSRPLKCALLGTDPEQCAGLRQRLGTLHPEVDWQIANPEAAWLVFCLQRPGSMTATLPEANRIDVQAFPTLPEQTLRDVLGAALDDLRPWN